MKRTECGGMLKAISLERKMREIKELKKLYEELGIEGLTIRRVRRKIKMIKSAFR